MNRIEGRLSQQQSISRFVQLFNTYSSRGGSNALARLLEPFLKILRRSPQITVRTLSQGSTHLAGVLFIEKQTMHVGSLDLTQIRTSVFEAERAHKDF